MKGKYRVQYNVPFKRHQEEHDYSTDDPVAFEEFLSELLEKEFRISAIEHNGDPVKQGDFDRMLRTAAGIMATRHICESLAIDSAEAHHRFGFAA